jgi:hypothetical protein
MAQQYLEGIPLPVRTEIVLDYAERVGVPDEVMAVLRELPDEQFRRLDDVGHAICDTQPAYAPPEVRVPANESDLYPGGDAYLQPHPEPGAVRDEKDVLEYEEQLVRSAETVGRGATFPRGRPDKGLEETETPFRKLDGER